MAVVTDLADFGEVVLALGSDGVLPDVPGIGRALTATRAIADGPTAISGRAHLLTVDALVPRRVAHAVSEGRAAAEVVLARRPQPQLTA